jgi:hypothetical protein
VVRELFKHQLSDYDVHLIENTSGYCQPVGDEYFRLQIEENYKIKLGQSSRGRAKKKMVKK